ncbi:MAG: hypothetical protein JXA57_00635, partial [Armatimonadetes bacterium]|nr:hypothetical protein [Armatimonadota bacterium]
MSGQRPAPTIGVTVSARAVGPQATGRAARSAAELCSALHRQHAEVLLLPPGADCSVSDLGGLVLGGGGDFDLALGLYTAPCSPNVLGDVDRARDDF